MQLHPALIAGVDNYAVMGNPVAHSKSPWIHATFARQTGEHIAYQAIAVDCGAFQSAVEQFRKMGGRGLNVTVPFKHEAWALCARRSARAEVARAVNTLWFDPDGTACGDNTDGVGLVRDLTANHALQIAGAEALLLGAGGAAWGVVPALLDAGVGRLVVANRTAESARALARHSGGGKVVGCGYEALAGQQFDLVINATGASLTGEVPPLPGDVLRQSAWCYDLMYSDRPTAFVVWGRDHGAVQALDGLGMLIEQAAEAFFIWRRKRPDTGCVLHELRAQMQVAASHAAAHHK